MIETLITGKLLRDVELKTTDKSTFCNFMLSVSTGEPVPVVITAIAFSDVAKRIAALQKNDAVSIVGTLKPTQWNDKQTGELKSGLSITVSNSLSVFDVKKRKAELA